MGNVMKGFKNVSQKLADDGVPYFVNPDDLRKLGIDPQQYLKKGATKGGGFVGYMLDRKKDAALIERLQSMHDQHDTKQ